VMHVTDQQTTSAPAGHREPLSGSNGGAHPNYRADIDGLRGVAVLAVVTFHAFPSLMRGGFVGVDVFFVISGFLISTIVFRHLQQGSFRLLDFYSRRIRRIFPALFVTLVFCYVLGWFTQLPDEFERLGLHIFAGATFISNFILWGEAGYFDAASELKPLLHLWSLGIEEQFYLVWPVIVWATWRNRRINSFAFICLLALASFALCLGLVRTDPVAAFYSPLTRIWELCIGSLLALILLAPKGEFDSITDLVAVPAGIRDRVHHWVSLTGFLLVAVAAFVLTKSKPFPGWLALLPTIGAALIIAAGPRALVNRHVLSNRVLVWFGLISFPLYLWHWPLLSFARIVEGQTPLPEIRAAAVVVAVLCAWATWRLVETPIRNRAPTKLQASLLTAAVAAIGVTGLASYRFDGLHFRSPELAVRYQGDFGHGAFFEHLTKHAFPCAATGIEAQAPRFEGYVRCKQSQSTENVEIVLLGDSLAEHLFIGLAESLPNKNVAFNIKASAPFIGNPDFSDIFRNITTSDSIKDVILTMRWARRLNDIPKGSTLERELSKVVEALTASGKAVYILDATPEFPNDVQVCKFQRPLSITEGKCSVPRSKIEEYAIPYRAALLSLQDRHPKLKVINSHDLFCDAHSCSMTRAGVPLFRDNRHLNIEGSRYIGKAFTSSGGRLFYGLSGSQPAAQ